MKRHSSRGFTLVEMVMTIVILGIVAGVLAPVIVNLTTNFVFTRNQADLTARGRIALERIAREVRYAVPNTLHVVFDAAGNNGIEFVRARGGGTYVAEVDDYGGAFTNTANRFPITPAARTGLYALVPAGFAVNAGELLVIGNTGPGDFTGSASWASLTGTTATTVAADGTTSGLILNFGARTFGNSFAGRRFVIADNVVEIGVNGTDLRWLSGALGGGVGTYDGVGNWGAASPLLVNGVVSASTSFAYAAGTPTAAGVLQIALTLTEGGSTVSLYQEVQVRNTP